MLCNFTQFCLAARRFSSSLICPCSWMHKGIFQCQGDRLTLLWEGNSQTEKRLRFFCICQERGFRGSRLREGWSGFAEVTPLPTPMSNWRAVMGTSQMQGLTENFELTSTESLEFLVSLFDLCSLFSPGVLVFYAIFWSEMWGHFSPIHEPDRCKPRLD